MICEQLQNAHLEGVKLQVKYDGYVYQVLV